jgi:beta-galactosidase
MGCNAIRTAHHPPAPELLDLCDEMGFLVMNEAFDVWEIAKTPFDYHWNFSEWYKRDLQDHVKRDRNHPSVIMWSIGNEIPEQLQGKNGGNIAKGLRNIIRELDTTRPITAGNNHPGKENKLIASGALDIIGCNYNHNAWNVFPSYYPGKIFIAAETVSGLQTRGEYMFPSDKLIRWGDEQNPVIKSPMDFTCSSFDQISTPWGSTHEETMKLFKKNDFVSGMFVWTGFDYLGEPTPYYWPARSSYFGIIDMAGFPKDVYYLYQSEWTSKPVLHVFPHWNWKENQLTDVWCYYNCADEVELFLNNQSLGIKKKANDALHVMWRIPFKPGTLRAISRKAGKTVLTKEIRTTGEPVKLMLTVDKSSVRFNENELAFLSVKVVDAVGNIVPKADHLISFTTSSNATIAGVDNGNPISHERFKASSRKAFHGLALVVVKPVEKGTVKITATAPGLTSSTLNITVF